MNRNEYIEQLLSTIPADVREKIDTSEWWWMPLQDQWRLTWLGYASFVDLGVESWEFDFGITDLKPWVYLTLSRNLKFPYYIVDNKKHNRLVLFDSKSAVIINLYGDLIRWIRTLN
jgi:hypothetical protein